MKGSMLFWLLITSCRYDMGYLVFIVCMLFSILSFFFDKKILSPKTVFPFYWGCLCLMSSLRFFGLEKVRSEIYTIVLCGVAFFLLGCWLTSGKYAIKKYVHYEYKLNKKFFDIVFWLALLFLITRIVVVISLVRSGINFAVIRYSYMDQIYQSDTTMIIYKFLLSPLIFTYIAGFTAYTITNKKIDVRFMIKSMLLVISEYVVEGDRSIIFFMIAGMLLAVWFSKNNFSKKTKREIRRLFAVFVILFILVIIIRGNSILESIYTYLVGCFNFFDNRINHVGKFTYGVTSFQGVLRPIMGIIERLGGEWNKFEIATDFMMSLQNNVIFLNKDSSQIMNYFATCFIWFYKDGGMIGVCVISLIYGMFSNILYKNMIKKISIHSVGLFIFIFYSILLGMMEFSFVRSEFVWGMIFFELFAIKRIQSVNSKSDL